MTRNKALFLHIGNYNVQFTYGFDVFNFISNAYIDYFVYICRLY